MNDASIVGQIHACPKCGGMVMLTPPPGEGPQAAAAPASATPPAAAFGSINDLGEDLDRLMAAAGQRGEPAAAARGTAAAAPHAATQAPALPDQPPVVAPAPAEVAGRWIGVAIAGGGAGLLVIAGAAWALLGRGDQSQQAARTRQAQAAAAAQQSVDVPQAVPGRAARKEAATTNASPNESGEPPALPKPPPAGDDLPTAESQTEGGAERGAALPLLPPEGMPKPPPGSTPTTAGQLVDPEPAVATDASAQSASDSADNAPPAGRPADAAVQDDLAEPPPAPFDPLDLDAESLDLILTRGPRPKADPATPPPPADDLGGDLAERLAAKAAAADPAGA
ncbi:MAG: hypothetical protein AAF790_14185, partial [Planctomycetota bacterium]